MAKRRVREDGKVPELSKQNIWRTSGDGYSAEALRKLEDGTYGRDIGSKRKIQYHTSQEQTLQARQIPALEGLTRSESWESNLGSKNKSRVDTTRARANYEQKIGHTPIGKALTEKDKAILYNGALRMLNNNMTAAEAANDIMTGSSNGNAGMVQGYARNKDWKAEYGKSLEELIDEYANNESAMKRHTEEIAHSDGDIAKTLGSTYMNAFVKPVMGAKAAIKNLINPESKSAENTNKLARIYSDMSNIAREDVKKGMSDTGKTVYDVGTNVADRVLPYLLPGGKGIGAAGTLFRTAEDKRESLEDRGITGRGAIGQSLVSGGIDAALDVVGLEKIKGLSALKESGNLVKAALGSAAIGGGEQAITSVIDESIDRIANGEDSVYSVNMQNYISQGMSEDEARKQALIDEATTLAKETGQGALFGAVMGAGGKAVNKAVSQIPTIKGALNNKLSEINNTRKSTAEKTGGIKNLLDLHNSMKQNTSGIQENAPLIPALDGFYSDNMTSLPKVDSELPELGRVDATNAGQNISARYETLKNSDLFTKSEANMRMLENAKESGVFSKDIENRASTRQEALDDYLNNPEAAITKNLNKSWDSGKDVDTSMLILHDALDADSQAYTNLVLLKQAEQSKSAGRELRALRDYAGTKECTVQKAGQYLNDMAEKELSNKKNAEAVKTMAERVTSGDSAVLTQRLGMDEANVRNITEALEAGANKDDIARMIAMYQAVGSTGVSREALQQVNAIYKQIDDMKLNPTSKQRAELEADAFKILAQDIGGKRSFAEQWNAWRYLAMLGNPKTHLRNIIGNTTHHMVTEIKDSVGALLEGAVDKANKAAGGEGIERTKALLGANDKNLVNAAALDADNVAYADLNDSGSKYNVKTELDRARDSFNNKTLSKIDEFNSNMLDKEDYSALKKKYSKSLARFLKANGADESIFNATDEASKALLDKGREYAIGQAKEATFHEYSKLAETLTNASNNLRQGNLVNKAGAMFLEGLIPFKKTPINILKQGVKYSPVSIAKSIATMRNAVKTGNKTASDAIEELAAGLTGTGIMALGSFLANQGILTGGANDDYDVDNAETEQGAQNYAIKIGDKSYTLDWLAPVSLPLFVGAELANMGNDDNEDESNVDRFFDALATIAEPVTEMSMLQGLQNALNELSYDRKNPIATMATNAGIGYVSQGIPTLAGQVARAVDDTRRATYSEQPQGYKRQFDKALTKMENKIPFLSMLNEPYVNAAGQTQQNEGIATNMFGNNVVTRLADQMLSPGYFKNGNVTPLDEELNRLYELTGESLYEDVSSGKVGTEKLNKEQFTKYQTLYGQNTDAFYNELFNSKDYQTFDDEQRAEAFKEAKRVSRMIADYEVGNKLMKQGSKEQSTDELIYDIYKSSGQKGVGQYLVDYAAAKNLDMSYKDYVKKEAEYEGGAEQYKEDKAKADELGMRVDTYNKHKNDAGGIEQYVEDKKGADELGIKPESYNKIIDRAGSNADKVLNAVPELKRNGLSGTNAYMTYANALNEIPSLSTGEFVRTFNAIDTDNSKGIKQDELLAYFNKNGFTSEDEALKVWRMYAPEGKKLPYLKKDGTWGKH